MKCVPIFLKQECHFFMIDFSFFLLFDDDQITLGIDSKLK